MEQTLRICLVRFLYRVNRHRIGCSLRPPHPFKFVLGRRCKQAHACDWDARMVSIQSLIASIRSEINEEAAEIVRQGNYTETLLSQASLTKLPYADAF